MLVASWMLRKQGGPFARPNPDGGHEPKRAGLKIKLFNLQAMLQIFHFLFSKTDKMIVKHMY